jgi:hypothetical protein
MNFGQKSSRAIGVDTVTKSSPRRKCCSSVKCGGGGLGFWHFSKYLIVRKRLHLEFQKTESFFHRDLRFGV